MADKWIVFHKGTGTFFAIEDEVVAVDVSKLTETDFEDFFDETEIEQLADTHGIPLSDELFDSLLKEELT